MGKDYASWMGAISDHTPLNKLSIPGTHQSMSRYGGHAAETQSMPIKAQLMSGIRVFDIRVSYKEASLKVYHGPFYQQATYNDVIDTIIDFLDQYPSEAIFIRLRSNSDNEGSKNLRRAYAVITSTIAENESYFWKYAQKTPILDEMRRKIILLKDFSNKLVYGLEYQSLFAQDYSYITTNWHLYRKWEKVKRNMQLANKDRTHQIFINYLSGSGGAFPYFVASGHSNPATSAPRLATGLTTPGWKNSWKAFPRVNCFIGICTIAFEGINTLAYHSIGVDFKNKVGIVMMDFPGYGLIERIIQLNNKYRD